jgi:hypothetical protein
MWMKSGKADLAVVSLQVGGAGLNCQEMNTIVFMALCPRESTQVQAQGKNSATQIVVLSFNNFGVGRIARRGQKAKVLEWDTIQCSEESFDKVLIMRREKNLTEAQAIFEVEGLKPRKIHVIHLDDSDFESEIMEIDR